MEIEIEIEKDVDFHGACVVTDIGIRGPWHSAKRTKSRGGGASVGQLLAL